MNKEDILIDIKKQMKILIDEMDFDNCLHLKNDIRQYFNFIESLKDLPVKNTPDKNEAAKESFTDNSTLTEEQLLETTVNKPIYKVERKIRGFFIPEIEAFIPESIARDLELNHHDYVFAKYLGNRKYEYTLAKRSQEEVSIGRIEYNFCIVEKKVGRLSVSSTIHNEIIKVNELPYTVLLHEDDIQSFNIQDGDVIDIAFPENEPDKHKIIWKYTTEKIPDIKSIKNKTKSKNTNNYNENEEIDQTLKGQTVYVVGNEPKRSNYKQKIEEYGGEFLFGDAKENSTFHEANIKQADKVIFLLRYSGHVGMKQVKILCKKHNKPLLTTFNTGINNIVNLAQEK